MKPSHAFTYLAAPALLGASLLGNMPPAQAISGGEKANSPYIVQLYISNGDGKKPSRCTGSALNNQWIITAAHCTEGKTSDTVSIYYSNDKKNPGNAHAADTIIEAGDADLSLIHLAEPQELTEYAHLASNHHFTPGEKGYIYGYGRGEGGIEVDWLRRAHVEQVDTGRDAYWNEFYSLKGINGTSNRGDSGGPLIVNSQLVGININGAHVADHYWIGEKSGSMSLAPYVNWIAKTTGVTATPYDPNFIESAADSPTPSRTDAEPRAAAEPSSDAQPAVVPDAEPRAAAEPSSDAQPAVVPAAEPTAPPATSTPSLIPKDLTGTHITAGSPTPSSHSAIADDTPTTAPHSAPKPLSDLANPSTPHTHSATSIAHQVPPNSTSTETAGQTTTFDTPKTQHAANKARETTNLAHTGTNPIPLTVAALTAVAGGMLLLTHARSTS